MALTEREVHDVADALNGAGKAPTYRAIRTELGYGSFSDIRDWLKTWRPKDQPESPATPVPTAVSSLALMMSNDLWLAALTKAEALAKEKLADALADKDTAEADAQRLAGTADEYAAENDRLGTALAEMTKKFEQASEWGRARELEATAFRAEVETLRATVEQLLRVTTKKTKAAKAKPKDSGPGPADHPTEKDAA